MRITGQTTNVILEQLRDIETKAAALRDDVAGLKLRMSAAEQQMRAQVNQLTGIDARFANFDERLAYRTPG
jgi:hypothetical protein